MTAEAAITYPGAASRPAWRYVRELASSAGVSVGTVYFYVKQGLLPRPRPAGPVTKYSDEHFLRLQAIVRLRRERMKLKAIRTFFGSATPEELVRAAGIELPPAPEAPPSPAREAPPPVVEPEPVAPPITPVRLGVYRPERAVARARWEHVAICPGVELHVRSDADGEALRVAREIEETYALRAGGSG
jgi:DNA-binding transcriptional MerR regulator